MTCPRQLGGDPTERRPFGNLSSEDPRPALKAPYLPALAPRRHLERRHEDRLGPDGPLSPCPRQEMGCTVQLMSRWPTLLLVLGLIVGCTDDGDAPATSGALANPTVEVIDGENSAEVPGQHDRSDCPQRMPPPTPTTTFRVELPDGRLFDTSTATFENEWELAPTDEAIALEVTAIVEADVSVHALSYVIKHDDAPEVVRSFPVAENVSGEVPYELRWDLHGDGGEPVAPGRYHLFGTTDVRADRRRPCDIGAGRHEEYGLGYFLVP